MEFKEDMIKIFEMIDLGYFVGIERSQRNDKKYIEDLLKKFKMKECKLVSTPLVTNEKLQKEDGAPEADAS